MAKRLKKPKGEIEMSVPVKLKELIDEMQMRFDELRTYYNKKTGEFVVVSEGDLRAAEEIEDEDNISEVDDVDLKEAIDIWNNWDDYVELPSKYDIDDYAIMENFCFSVENSKHRSMLLNAIEGKGAFRRFKDMIRRLGLEGQWYKFQDQEYKEIAIDWCKDNELEYEE